ncbi:hypothetical protein, partial [Glycomyces tenuis]
PPFQPPGGYAPMPPGPAPRRRRGPVILASVLSVALVAAIGAFVFFNFFWTSGPDPAERFPSSASMYLEVNLDPSFDQTPKLIDHLNKFEGLDYDDTNDILADVLEEAGMEDVDADEDIASWLGRRHGMAMWSHDEQPYAVVNLASTDAEAAEAGLEKIRESSGVSEDQWAYTVGDDSVLMVAGDSGAAAALEAAESEAGSSPLSGSDSYEEARSWLDGDQLAVYWFDVEAFTETVGMMGDEGTVTALGSTFSGHFIAGFSAFDEGFELSYRHFGEEDNPWTGSEELLADMGEMPASDIAVTADVPENLAEITEEWTSELEGLSGETDGGSETTDSGPLTDEEYAEYQELDQQWWDDTLAPEDEERYYELEQRYWTYGTEDDPVETDYDTGSDYEDALGEAEEFIDLLSGAQLSIAADFPAEGGEFDPETLFASVVLSEDRAEELNTMIEEMSGGEALPEGVEVDGSSLSYEGGGVADGTLADDERFSAFADAAPDSAAFGVWVDLADVSSYEEFSGAEPLSAFAWAQGSVDGDGTGLARLYLK